MKRNIYEVKTERERYMKDIHGERKIITNLNRMAAMTATDNEKLQ